MHYEHTIFSHSIVHRFKLTKFFTVIFFECHLSDVFLIFVLYLSKNENAQQKHGKKVQKIPYSVSVCFWN